MTLAAFLQWSGIAVWVVITALIVHFVIAAPARALIQALSRLFFEMYCMRLAGKKMHDHALRRAIECVLQWTCDALFDGPVVVESGPHTWDGHIWYGRWKISKNVLDRP